MKKIIFSFAALAALTACVQENSVVDTPQAREVSIVATAADTKTVLNGDAVNWESGDEITLKFTGSEVVLEKFQTSDGAATATFVGTISNDVTTTNGYAADVYAVYPSSAMNDEGAVVFELPAIQSVAPGSFPSGMNLSSSKLSLDELTTSSTVNADFLNAFSIIRFVLPENVVSLKVTGTENLAGAAEFAFDAEGGRLAVDEYTAGSASVSLTPKDDDVFVAGETYNVLVYPGQHTSMTVELTDVDNCTYSKTVTADYNFVASNYYTFTFKNQFSQDFTFTVDQEGDKTAFTDGEKVMAVFTKDSETDAVEIAAKDNSFTINRLHGALTDGYVVYPSSAYVDGAINYTLAATGTPADLYSSLLSVGTLEFKFNSVANILSKLTFTVPAGVTKVTIISATPLAGTAVMKVNSSGELAVATKPAAASIELTGAGEKTINVYPFTNAELTFTFEDQSGTELTVTRTVTAAAGQTATVELPTSLNFDKSGSFSGEDFNDGGSYEF